MQGSYGAIASGGRVRHRKARKLSQSLIQSGNSWQVYYLIKLDN
ncbi:hypothetical protein [Nostoc commune]|nr:hypothetical protein [Nostoc commune]